MLKLGFYAKNDASLQLYIRAIFKIAVYVGCSLKLFEMATNLWIYGK